jgi:hypothetical protein
LVRRLGAEHISRKPAANTVLIAPEDTPIGSRKRTEPTSLCIGLADHSCSRITPPFVDCLRVAAPSLPVVLVFPFTAALAAFRRGASGLGWIADDRLTHGRWILQRIAPGNRTPNGLGRRFA